MRTTEQLIATGQAAAAAGDWSAATSALEAAYQNDQNYELNLQLVTALCHTQNYTQASLLALEYETRYLESDQTADTLISCLCQSQQFIQARLSAQLRVQSAPAWLKTTQQRIFAAEQDAERTMAQTLTATMKQFYHLSELPVAAQIPRLTTAKHLTFAKYLTAAKFLLVDPFLHQLSRVEVLYTLKGLGVTDEVTFIWLDQTQLTLIPAKLPVMGADAVSEATQQELRRRLGQQDVALYESLQGLLSLQLMYLYPVPEKIVTDVQTWIDLLIASQTRELSPKLTVSEQKMLDNQQKIQELNLELVQ
ncbi:hypothetical protein ACFQH1_12845 [Lactiplantibacillus daoliensis]|uniref:TPR repeat-containing protein n=1 Tax=Lactiplantibacillus daoliensis TaxID=2559916 RepID=A0ABW1ULW9_9LACO|nr:hypothetical protein [Lactiplantibacillus daoliensis]